MIVESRQTYSEMCDLIEKQDFILIPVFYDNSSRPSIDKISLLYFYFIKTGQSYVLPFNHPDCILGLDDGADFSRDILNKILLAGTKKFIIDKREMSHCLCRELDENWLDMRLLNYVDTGKQTIDFEEYTPAHQFLYRKFYRDPQINLMVPVTKHIEFLEDNKNKILRLLEGSFYLKSSTYEIMNTAMLDTLYNLESSGIRVNLDIPHITKGGIAFSKYNPYTITNRPSCAHSGFNFIGLNKEDGSRKRFISRFGEDGMLLLIDYNACHFYLVADIIGYKFKENPYDELGKLYFNKQELTEEEHSQAKLLSFNVIYGVIPDEFLNIPFFKMINDFRKEMHDAYKSDGYIETKYFRRKLYSNNIGTLSPNKLFNYYMQAAETESHMIILAELFKKMRGLDTKIILYIYDSILIDFKISEGRRVIDMITSTLEQDGRFPVSISYGTNYHQMSKLS